MDKLEAVAAQCRNTATEAIAVHCDVARREDVHKLVRAACDRFGRLNVMVANAGYGFLAKIQDVSDAEFDNIVQVNVKGTLYAMQEAAAVMLRQPPAPHAHPRVSRGHIIVISSAAARRGLPLFGVYSMTKAAQLSLAEAMRVELSGATAVSNGRAKGGADASSGVHASACAEGGAGGMLSGAGAPLGMSGKGEPPDAAASGAGQFGVHASACAEGGMLSGAGAPLGMSGKGEPPDAAASGAGQFGVHASACAEGGVYVSTVHPITTATEFFEVASAKSRIQSRGLGRPQSAEHVAQNRPPHRPPPPRTLAPPPLPFRRQLHHRVPPPRRLGHGPHPPPPPTLSRGQPAPGVTDTPRPPAP